MANETRSGSCSMRITINGVQYVVRPHAWTDQHKIYLLVKQIEDKAQYKTGLVGNLHVCNCPDQTKNRPEGGCKHIKAMRALWLI